MGMFFSFELSGIELDMVILLKLFSGYGLFMVLVLFKFEWD